MNERDELRIHAYLDGALSPEERAAFEAELQRDEVLRAEYEALAELDRALRAATENDRLASGDLAIRTIRGLAGAGVPTTGRSIRLAAALLGALLLGFTTAELLCVRPIVTESAPSTSSEPIGNPIIASVLGEVVSLRPNAKGGANAALGDALRFGDALSTASESSVLVALPGTAEIALGKSTMLTIIDESHCELGFGHAIVLRKRTAPPFSISVPGVAAEIIVEDGSCELDWPQTFNAKKAGPTLLRVRALAGVNGTARVRIRDRELRAGDAILVDVDSLRDDTSAAPEAGWFVDLMSARDR